MDLIEMAFFYGDYTALHGLLAELELEWPDTVEGQ
jgi:hypothetical protein